MSWIMSSITGKGLQYQRALCPVSHAVLQVRDRSTGKHYVLDHIQYHRQGIAVPESTMSWITSAILVPAGLPLALGYLENERSFSSQGMSGILKF